MKQIERPRLTIRPVPSTRPTFAGEMKFTLISSVGANSPRPRVGAWAGESVSSNIAASVPPRVKPTGLDEIRAGLHLHLDHLLRGIEFEESPAQQLRDRRFRDLSLDDLRE